MNLEDIIYLDPLLNLFNGLDIGSLLLTCKNLQQTILPYIDSKTIYKPITLYQLFFEFDYKLFSEINKLNNPNKLLEEIIKLTNTNINEFYIHIMNIYNNTAHIDIKLNKITSDIYYLMEYYYNRQFYDNMIKNKQWDNMKSDGFVMYTMENLDYQPTNHIHLSSFELYPMDYQPSGCVNLNRGYAPSFLKYNDDVDFLDGTFYCNSQFNGNIGNFNKEYTAPISKYGDCLQHLIICFKLPELPAKYKYKQQWNYNFFKKIEMTATVVGTIFSYSGEELLINDLLNQDKLIKQFYNIIDNTMYFIIDFKLFAQENNGIILDLLSGPKLKLEIGSIFELIDNVDYDDVKIIDKLELIDISINGKYGVIQDKYKLKQIIHHRKFYELKEKYLNCNTIKIEYDVKLCNVCIFDNNNDIVGNCEIKQLTDFTYEYIMPNNYQSKFLIIEYEAPVNNFDTKWNDVGICRWHCNFSHSILELL